MMIFRKPVVLIFILFISKSINSNAQNFVEASSLTGYNNVFEQVSGSSTAFSDVNGDGKPDVLITGQNSGYTPVTKLYTNSGTNFDEVTGTPFIGMTYGTITFSDVNGDGNPDLLMTGSDFSLYRIAKLYTNSGTNFTEVIGTPFVGVNNSSASFSDVNGDGKPDLLISGLDNANNVTTKLYTNSGTNFTEVSGTPFAQVYDGFASFSDVNGDGKPDALITGCADLFCTSKIIKLYTNSGTNFDEIIGTPFTAISSGSVAFSDVNGDSKPDVLIVGAGASNVITAKLYTNSGNNFAEVSGTPFTGVRVGSIAFSDINGDGKSDVLITGNTSFPGALIAKLYTNSGNNFTEVLDMPFEGVESSFVAFKDVNNDGKPDVLITGQNASNNPTSKLYLNFAPTRIVGQPPVTVCGGTLRSLSVSATGDNLSYLWSNNATTAGINTSVAGIYVVTVTGNGGVVVSNAVNVLPQTVIVIQPLASATVCSGIVQTFTVSATGLNLKYAWPNNETISGINTSVTGAYIVTTSGTCGSVVSNAAVLSNYSNTQILNQPVASTVCSGVVQTFSVSASGANLSYMWSNGGTNSTINTSISGAYTVTVSGTCGSVISNTASLISIDCTPSITGVVCDSPCKVGSVVTLSGVNLPTVTRVCFRGLLDPVCLPPTSSNSTTIEVNIPVGAIPGEVTLTGVNGNITSAIVLDFTTNIQYELSGIDFQIFPNPNNGRFTLVYSGFSDVSYAIINNIGITIETGKLTTGENKLSISLVRGIYVFKMGNSIKKFVVE